MQRKPKSEIDQLTGRCLAAFVEAGSLDLSLDHLAAKVGISKRMLIHYFGSRENLEEAAFALLEERLRATFRAELFQPGISLQAAVSALWDQTTAAHSRGTLLVVMDATRRAWSGSERAKAFYAEQQRLWIKLLANFLPDPAAVEELLQLFQGAILAYLVTGDRDMGKRALARMILKERAGATPS
ncbi:MAG: TetR/AcrR family transcriptional regulator [Terracidiphilus sp.]